jgi:hypothetical protein|tara:strand:+ start:53 stop:718 length:666 start_codon:yes stop_codon:yes gene_type:complete
MKKILIFYILITSLISCNDNQDLDNLDLPYFEFKKEDYTSFLELPELNKKITFENQNNEKLVFEVIKSENKKELHLTGSFVYGSTKYFYYDEQKIYLRSTLFDYDDTSRYVEISLKRWPIKFNDGRNGKPRVISNESQLITNINYAPFNNTGQHINVSYLNKMTLVINGVDYNKVIKVDLTNTESISNNWWNIPSLNYFYFDVNKGILGFDDKQGNIWRVK